MARYSTPEGRILKACLTLLQSLGIPAYRSNSGGMSGSYTSKRTGKTKKRFVRFAGIEGLSDITGILPELHSEDGNTRHGVFLAIECKSPGNEATEKQMAYLRMISKAGGVALVVHSPDELLEDLRAEGVQTNEIHHQM